MINKYTNKQRGLLAVIMAMVMVFAGAVFVAAEVDASSVPVYVSNSGDDTNGDGTQASPYKTIMKATEETGVTDIVLLSNVDWYSGTGFDDISVSVTIKTEGTSKYTINVTTSISVTADLVIQNCTIKTTNDDAQFVIGSNATIKTEGCIFTTESTVTDPHAVNTQYAGGAEFINTNFNDMKVTYVTTDIVMTFKDCQNVYVNTGKSVTIFKLEEDAVISSLTEEGIYIDKDTDVSSFKVYQGITVTISSGMNLEAEKIFVKDHTIAGGLGTIKGAGSITGSFVLYEPQANGEQYADVILEGITFVGRNSIAENVHVTVKSATIAPNATLSVAGQVLLDTTYLQASLTNNGKIFVTSEEADIPPVIEGTGSVDNSAVQEDAYFGGSIVTKDTVFSSNQIVNIVADTELKDALLIIKGTLIVPEGVTLTLSGESAIWIYGSESKLYNNGTIVVASVGQQDNGLDGVAKIDPRPVSTEDNSPIGSKGLVALGIYGGYAENNGDIYLSYEPEDESNYSCFDSYALHIQEAVFENNGNIQVDEFNTLGINVAPGDKKTILNNNEGASMTVEGVLIGYVDNASTITIDGTAWGYISLVTTDAVIDIVSLQTIGTGLLIDNEELFIKKNVYVETIDSSENKVKAASSITLTTTPNNGTNTYAIEGLTVGTAFVYEKADTTKWYFPYIDISGAVSGESTVESDSTVDVGEMILTNDVRVTTTLSIPDEIKTFGSHGALTVSGEMTLDFVSGGFTVSTVTVTGKLVSTEELTNVTTLTASYYEIKEDKVNNIAKQHIYTNFADAVSAAPKKITVFGDVEVSTEITVPAGIEITFTNGTLKVTTDGKLTVADGSKMKLATISGEVGGADVKGVLHFENKKNLNGTVKSDVVITDDKSVTYCGIAYAMANATAGQTVTVSEGAANPLNIEKDVTIPAGVILDTGAVDEVKVCKGATLTIDGTLDLGAAKLTIEPKDADQTVAGAKPAGKVVLNGTIVSEDKQDAEIPGAYYTMTVKGVTGYYIEPVATVAPKIATVDDLTIEIKAFTTELALGDVSFTGTTEDSAVVKIAGKVNGNITLDLASVEFGDYAFKGTITNGTGTFASEGTATTGFKVKSTTTDDVEKLTVSGEFDAGTNKTITITGDVTFSNFDADAVTVDGNVTVVKPSSGDATSTITNLKVNGTVTVDNDAVLSVTTKAEVLGSITAVSATDSKGAGKANIVADLYLGLTKKMVTGAGAAISENVSVSGYMYVVDGSTFPADMVKDKKYVALYVEDALWMTVYYLGTDSEPVIEVSEVPIENVKLVDWIDDKGVSKTKDAGGEDTFTIDVNNQKLYAKINYNVYLVKFSVSEGIDDIYIDGVLVDTIENVKAKFVAAGQHTVSYTLANGYTGEAKMLVDGKEVSGYTFTTEGEFENVTYTITLQGIEKAPAEVGGGDAPVADKDEGMDLTDILLIVLVVLIVIMAIIVALRMMRS